MVKIPKILVPFAFTLVAFSVKSNELVISIDSYSDAIAYIEAAYRLGFKNKCWASNTIKKKVDLFIENENSKTKYVANIFEKIDELKGQNCEVLSSIIEMVAENKIKILAKYPTTTDLPNESDWKKLPDIDPIYYTENWGSKAILTINHQNYPEVRLLTVNPSCNLLQGSTEGKSFMYVNKKMVSFAYVCGENQKAVFFALNKEGKDYILRQFKEKATVCYALTSEVKGLCFSANGFNESKKKILEVIRERNLAI